MGEGLEHFARYVITSGGATALTIASVKWINDITKYLTGGKELPGIDKKILSLGFCLIWPLVGFALLVDTGMERFDLNLVYGLIGTVVFTVQAVVAFYQLRAEGRPQQ